MSAARVAIARLGELAPGETKKFLLAWQGAEVEAFVVNHGGELHAYVNRCRHVPMTMDWVENRFLTEDGAYIQCATHGAWYEPDTGVCVAGPPVGKALIRVPLTVDGEVVYAAAPADEAV
jgi:nitrite reductase/ring-hydroxylating ferredoxin subunit